MPNKGCWEAAHLCHPLTTFRMKVFALAKSGVAQQERESTSGPVEIGLAELIKKVRIYTVGLEIRLSVDGNSSAGLW